MIDTLEEFDKLNTFAVESKHELKDTDGNFFIGMALMKNMTNK
jgi:hypothetical protein